MAILSRSTCVPLAALALFAAGCGNADTIQTYTVPKSTQREAPAHAVGDYRLLGAMFPADDPQWFFKFSGKAGQIASFEADFDKILASVKLPAGGGTPEFTLPEGWKRGGPRGVVAATIAPPGSTLEVTITQSGGGMAFNLDRWVKQIGLIPGPDDAAKYTKPIDAMGVKGLRVDMTGPKNPATMRGGR